MKSNKLIIFTIITIAVVVAAMMMSQHRAPSTSLEKKALFPGLPERVNEVTTIALVKQDKSLTRVQNENQWVIEQADLLCRDFPTMRDANTLFLSSRKVRSRERALFADGCSTPRRS